MKYVKLIAKPNTWFKAGTEVFDYDEFGKRIKLEDYNIWLKSRTILVRGTRICQFPTELLIGSGYKMGEERIDGELCGINEFDMTIVDDEKDIPWPDPLDYSKINTPTDKLDQNFKDGIRHIQG
jgi:hypothetical protein